MDYLVVVGGGGGGGVYSNSHGGGGGAGGFRSSNETCMSAPLTSPLANPAGLTANSSTSYPITVGAGGTGVPVSGPSTRKPRIELSFFNNNIRRWWVEVEVHCNLHQ